MSRYITAQLGMGAYHLLSQSSLSEAQDEIVPAEGQSYYGLGWGIADAYGTKLVYHLGGTNGSSSFIGFLPEKGLGFVLLTSEQPGSTVPKLERVEGICESVRTPPAR